MGGFNKRARDLRASRALSSYFYNSVPLEIRKRRKRRREDKYRTCNNSREAQTDVVSKHAEIVLEKLYMTSGTGPDSKH